jgi:hypothetical protein
MTDTDQPTFELTAAVDVPSDEAGITRRDLLFVSLILVAAAAALLAYHHARTGGDFSAILYPDERSYYLAGAEAIRDQGLGWYLTPRSLWNGPLNPLWIAILGSNVAAVKVANIALFVATGALVWDMARRLFSKPAAYIALIALALFVPFYRFVPTILTEPLFVPLVILGLWLVVAFGNRAPTLIGAGAAFGGAALVRPILQLFPLLLLAIGAVALLIAYRRATATLEVLKPMLLIAAGFAILVVPFGIKNLVALDKVGIANGSGSVLYLGSDLRKHGFEPVDVRMDYDTAEITAPYAHFDSEGDALLMEEALDRIGRNPVDVALLQPSKLLKLTFGSPEHYFRPQSDIVAFFQERSGADLLQAPELFLTALIIVLGAAGLVVLPVPLLPRIVLASLVLYLLVFNTLLFPLPRLFLPAIPVLIIFAAGLITSGRRWLTIAAVLTALAIGTFIAFMGLTDEVPTVSEQYVGYFDEVVTIDGALLDSSNDVTGTDGASLLAAGPDPYLVYDNDDFDAALNQIVFITLETTAPDGVPTTGTAQLFWRTADTGFSDDRSEVFEIIVDGRTHIYAISPSFRKPWEQVIVEFRLDLPDRSPGLVFRVDDLTVKR